MSGIGQGHEARALGYLAGGRDMAARMRAHDWIASPLGPIATWPQSLLSALSMLLPSKAQIILFWGPQFVVLYNDAYRPVFGAKHPQSCRGRVIIEAIASPALGAVAS